MQNSEEVVRIDLSVLLVIQSFICNKGGREVLVRIVFLRGSSGCLNIGSCSFHLVVARKQGGRVVLRKTQSFLYASWCLYKWK